MRKVRFDRAFFHMRAFGWFLLFPLFLCVTIIAAAGGSSAIIASGELSETALKQSDWWQNVQQNISETEYEVSYQEHCLIPGGKAGYHMANRAQNLRAYFYPEGMKVVRRTESSPSWVWGYQLSGFGREGRLQSLATPSLTAEKNRIDYGYGIVTERYENREAGIKQSFMIAEKTNGTGLLVLMATLSGDLHARYAADGSTVEFLHQEEAVMHYGGLVVLDANGRELAARLSLHGDQLQIMIEDGGAVYPVTIDPFITGLSSSPDWTMESDQAQARLGNAVATAGDVNGDGYSDVIVGAYLFDNGQNGEGTAFVFHGSASGLLTTATWRSEGNVANAEYGWTVSTAGDVNGDGYADVIVGAHMYSNGQSFEGIAYVYHGSASGLSTTADWFVERNDAGDAFGESVSTAGDVNGDGYSDVIVGAQGYNNGQSYEGAAFVYHGSGSGLSTSADWTAESDQASAYFGKSVSTAGDVNGDGYSDVIVGAFYYDNPTVDEGVVFVWFGSASGLGANGTPANADWMAQGNQVNARFGYSVATAGDVNGDGYSEVIVGAWGYTNPASDEGAAFVWFGSASGLGANGTPANADWTAEGSQAGADLGWSVSTAGDVNGDSYADVIVGAVGFDNVLSNEGAAFVWFGSASGLGANGSPGNADWTFESDEWGASCGRSVSTAGDVNGDGYADVIVGANMFDNDQAEEGRAYVFHGSVSGLAPSAGWTAESDLGSAYLGFSVSTAGDVNGDGYADVVVGAYRYDNGQTDEGRVYVYHGSGSGLSTFADSTLESDYGWAYFGNSVSTAGDVNGDGYADVIVGAYTFDNTSQGGRAYAYHGSASGLSSPEDWSTTVGQAWAYFGESVSTAGDVNGDGYADVIVGAWGYDNGLSNEGRAYVFHGSASGLSSSADWMAESNQEDAYFGESVSTAGDVNGDGYADVIVGAPFYDNTSSNEGAAFVWLGSASGLGANGTPGNADWTVSSDQPLCYFGNSVSTAGDVNGDGYADVIVGAYTYENPSPNEGTVYVYHGSGSGLSSSADWMAESDQGTAWFGISVSTAGDVNGDGYADVIVGAELYNNGQTDEGAAFVWLGSASGLGANGNPGNADWTAESDQGSASFGFSVGTAGDVNADGYSEVIVGAYQFDNDQTDEGRAFLYYGNGEAGVGLSLVPQQRRADDSVPIGPLGISDSDESFRLAMLARSPFGRGKVKLEWEVKPLGTLFDGTGTQLSTSWTDPATSTVQVNEVISGLSGDTVYHWRERLRYHQATTPYQQYSRWVTMPWDGWQEGDLRTEPTPTPTPTGPPPGIPDWQRYGL